MGKWIEVRARAEIRVMEAITGSSEAQTLPPESHQAGDSSIVGASEICHGRQINSKRESREFRRFQHYGNRFDVSGPREDGSVLLCLFE